MMTSPKIYARAMVNQYIKHLIKEAKAKTRGEYDSFRYGFVSNLGTKLGIPKKVTYNNFNMIVKGIRNKNKNIELDLPTALKAYID